MTKAAKKRWFDVLRVVVCVAALWIVVRGVTLDDHVVLKDGRTELVGIAPSADDPGPTAMRRLSDAAVQPVSYADIATDADGAPRIAYGLRSAWRNSRKSLLLLAIFIHFPVVFPQALRFRWLLAAQKITVGYWECVKLSLAGNFLNFATPFGSNAGDVFKAYFVSLHTEHKTEAVTTVVLDRVIGLGSLLIVVAGITLLGPPGTRLDVLRPYMLGLIAIGVGGTALYFWPTWRKWWAKSRWLTTLPMIDHLKRVDRAAHTLAGHTMTLVAAVLITIGLQLMALLAYFVVAVALGLDAHAGNILEYFAYFYSGVLVQALPGPPQGLGTVELTYRYFFAPFGSASQIVCMAFAIRAVVLICALPGLLVTATGSYRPKEVSLDEPSVAKPADILPPNPNLLAT